MSKVIIEKTANGVVWPTGTYSFDTGIPVDITGGSIISGSTVFTGGSITMSSGSTVVTAGSITFTTGSSVVTSGSLDYLAAGNVAVTSGSIQVTSGSLSYLAGGNVAVTSGSIQVTSGSITTLNGADVAQGSTTDARSAATDTTAATIVSLLKEISYLAQNQPPSILASTTSAVTGASGSAVALTFAASGSAVPTAHVISGVAWSYSGSPTGGSITVETPSGSVVRGWDVTSAGPGFIPFVPPIRSAPNTALVINMSSGSTGVVAKLNVLGKWTE